MDIAEISKKYDISVRTIRYYEEIGIIRSTRSKNNVRTFDFQNENRLLLTLLLKELNIKLKDIKEIVCGDREAKICELLIKEQNELDLKITQLTKRKRLISSIINSYGAKDITKHNIKEFMRQQLYVSVKNERLENILMGDENIMIEIGEALIPIAAKEDNSLISAVKNLRESLAEENNILFDKIRIKDNVKELKSYEYRIMDGDKIICSEELCDKNENEQIKSIINNLRKHIVETK